MRVPHNQRGFSLIEILIVVAIIGVLALISVPSFQSWQTTQRARSAARTVGDALTAARHGAIRTSIRHVVFLRIAGVGTTDPSGTDLLDASGLPVDVTLLQDDDGDCYIDAGEPIAYFPFDSGIRFGPSAATVKAPADTAAPSMATGVTFSNPESPAAALRWVMFRPDGIPVAFSGDLVSGCDTVGTTGSGGGGIYLTNGDRDFAVVMAPLGGVRLHAWEAQNSAWTN